MCSICKVYFICMTLNYSFFCSDYLSNYGIGKLDKSIQPALEKCNDDLYQRISEQGKQFEAYKSRLLLVREIKYKKLVRELSGFADDDETENDCNSELGSIITRSSRSLSSAGTKRLV